MKKVYLVSHVKKSNLNQSKCILNLPFAGVYCGRKVNGVELSFEPSKLKIRTNCVCICNVLIEKQYQSRLVGKLISIKYV